MNQTDVEKIAIFRYGILAPYITTGGNGYAGPYDFFRSAAQKGYTDPITGKENNEARMRACIDDGAISDQATAEAEAYDACIEQMKELGLTE